MTTRTTGTEDKPFRPSPCDVPEDIRQDEIRTNQRIDALLRRVQDLEDRLAAAAIP